MRLATGSKGPDVERLQRGLSFLGFKLGKIDGDFGHKTEKAVVAFQTRYKLYADGVVGLATLGVYNRLLEAAKAHLYTLLPVVEDPPAPDVQVGSRLKWVTCQADKAMGSGGYNHLTLRSDCAGAYLQVLGEVHRLGGIITTAGGRRPLSAAISPNRSQTSFHYTGRAFDLATDTGMQNPTKDPYLVVRNDNTRMWTVWCKSSLSLTDLSQLTKVPCMTLFPTVTKAASKKGHGIKITTESVTVTAFNLTALMAQYKFVPIPSRLSFFEGHNYMGAEWWHWNYVEGLTEGVSTFGGELLKVYPLSECQKLPRWEEVKDRRYKVSWF